MIENINYKLPDGDRCEIRLNLIKQFLQEIPGRGKGNLASRYRYDVEKYDKYKIYLKRPTRLNKGFDFTVNIDGIYFKKNKKYANPSHKDIINILNEIKNNYCLEYDKVKKVLNDIYNCNYINMNNINMVFTDYEGNKHPIQIVFLAIKWLFIEQDCAYWNYSGRAMFYDSLKNEGLA